MAKFGKKIGTRMRTYDKCEICGKKYTSEELSGINRAYNLGRDVHESCLDKERREK